MNVYIQAIFQRLNTIKFSINIDFLYFPIIEVWMKYICNKHDRAINNRGIDFLNRATVEGDDYEFSGIYGLGHIYMSIETPQTEALYFHRLIILSW